LSVEFGANMFDLCLQMLPAFLLLLLLDLYCFLFFLYLKCGLILFISDFLLDYELLLFFLL